MKHTINKEPFFAADESQAEALLEFTARARSKDLSGPRLLILVGAPASAITRVSRAIPDENDRALPSRDEPEGLFESWGDDFEIANRDVMDFDSAEEYQSLLEKATLPAEDGGRLFGVVCGREVPLKPEIEARAVRVVLLAPAVAEA